MKKLSTLALCGIVAAGAFTLSDATAQAGADNDKIKTNPRAEAEAERRHNAKPHGLPDPKSSPAVAGATEQPIGNAKAQEYAERKHNAKPHGVNAIKAIALEDGSTVYVFADGKMGMEDKHGRAMPMKAGHVMKAKDGSRIAMVGNEVMRVESVLKENKSGSN